MVVPRANDYALYHRLLGGLLLTDHKVFELLNDFKKPQTLSEAVRAHPDLSTAQLNAFRILSGPETARAPPITMKVALPRLGGTIA
jgi:hypothetical protein